MADIPRALPGLARIRETVISGRLVNRSLEIDSRHLSECAELWGSGEFTQVVLSSYREAFDLRTLEFLKDFPPITSLQIYLRYEVDLSPLKAHAEHLRAFLANDGINGIMDFAPYTHLGSVGQTWREGVRFPESMEKLERMAWTNFRPKDKVISVLPKASRLNRLSLVSANISSMAGVEQYQTLSELSVCNAPNLSDVSALRALATIHALTFEGCKRLENATDYIQHLPLVELSLIKCGAIPSVSFVQQLHELRSLILLDTNVVDGDMSILLAHPTLEHVAFNKKKHFSHSDRDVMDALTTNNNA